MPSNGDSIGMKHRMNRRLLLAASIALPWTGMALAQRPEPTGPQAELAKEKLVIVTRAGAAHAFDVEMALTPEQQEVGEMFRSAVPADGGMLFDWGMARESQMWMKNTLASLDMVFINADGTIRSIAENTVPRSLAVVDSRGPVRATLELAAGVTAKRDIRVGDKVQHRIFGTQP
jgi:uncharacterized membrane protein (UPF0127 family)